MGYQLLLLDIDGTLRPMDSPVIPEENVRALGALQKHGIRVAIAKEGDKVKKGQLLLKFDMKLISGKGYKLVTPMIVTNADEVGDPAAAPFGDVKAGDVVVTYGK